MLGKAENSSQVKIYKWDKKKNYKWDVRTPKTKLKYLFTVCPKGQVKSICFLLNDNLIFLKLCRYQNIPI